MVVARALAMRAQQSYALHELAIPRDHRTCVPPSAQVLRGIEREGACVPDGAHPAAAVARAVGLRGVLDDEEIPLRRQAHERLEVDGATIQVDRDHAANSGPE